MLALLMETDLMTRGLAGVAESMKITCVLRYKFKVWTFGYLSGTISENVYTCTFTGHVIKQV